VEQEQRTESAIRTDDAQVEQRSLTTAIVTQAAEAGADVAKGVAVGVGTYLATKKLGKKSESDKG
jgi:hypothetical protein